MNVWVPILLLLIPADIWWFGAHCTAYLSDNIDLLDGLTKSDQNLPDKLNQN